MFLLFFEWWYVWVISRISFCDECWYVDLILGDTFNDGHVMGSWPWPVIQSTVGANSYVNLLNEVLPDEENWFLLYKVLNKNAVLLMHMFCFEGREELDALEKVRILTFWDVFFLWFSWPKLSGREHHFPGWRKQLTTVLRCKRTYPGQLAVWECLEMSAQWKFTILWFFCKKPGWSMIKGSLDEKLPSYEVLKMRENRCVENRCEENRWEDNRCVENRCQERRDAYRIDAKRE